LADAMLLLAVAVMRPDITFDELRVSTYRELVDLIMREVANNRIPPIIVEMQHEVAAKYRSDRILKYGS
jgi:hypothetical protein